MSAVNNLERTDWFGNPVTLQAWLFQLGKWDRLARRMGALANPALWQKPVTTCVAWEFSLFDWVSWKVRDIETHKVVPGIWEGVPEDLVHHVSADHLVQEVIFPSYEHCRLDHWIWILNEAIVRYDPVAAFRHGRFLRTRPRKFRDASAITAILSNASKTEVVDTMMDFHHPEVLFPDPPEWGWKLWNRWRLAQSEAVRGALLPLCSPKLTAQWL